jgi:23S rRNA pseudouridine1911/1915/1917 synthase
MKNITYNDINIVFEDNHILVAVKPQNVGSCPDETGDANLLDLLKEYIKVTHQKEGNVFLGLVHRLDRPTGGVMVFAKTSKAAARFAEAMKVGEFEKKYFAVTMGVPKDARGQLKHALYKNEAKNEVYTVPLATEGAKIALLDYRILQEVSGCALVSINLITGRSHQARVQFQAIGTPLFGDQKYGGGKTPVGYNLALWAAELRFTHPTTKQIMVFRVDPPGETPWNKFLIPSLI